MLHQDLCELCCHACKSRVIINWQQRRSNLYLTDKVTISLILNMFECLHVLVLTPAIQSKLDFFYVNTMDLLASYDFCFKDCIVLALNHSLCIKKKKFMNSENDETNYDPNDIYLLYGILH